ncbi:MAG TPA: hypothetical protein PK640_15785, partial [Verrucomicrobiota bacterium]|nr:hypothetical protein [Verrucomicrobiota bacterium]
MKRFGYPGVVELPSGIRFSRSGGWIRTRYWEGTTDQMRGISSAAYKSGATDIEMIPERDGRKATCSASFGGADDSTPAESQIESIWELDENQGDISIWNHPKIQAIFAALSLRKQAYLRSDIEKFALGDAEATGLEYGPEFTDLLANSSTFQTWLTRLASSNGQATYYCPDAIVRHTLTGPQTWKYSFNFDHVATLIFSAVLQASEPTLNLTLPAGRTWPLALTRIDPPALMRMDPP